MRDARPLLLLTLMALATIRCELDANLGSNLPCPNGLRCPAAGGMLACVDPERDPNHCGACSVACASTEGCVGGVCVRMRCAPDDTRCDGNDVLRCQRDGLTERRERCAMGEECRAGACVLPAIAWPASYRFEPSLRPALDRTGWSSAEGRCGTNGPSDAPESERVWVITSDWGVLWRSIDSTGGFTALRARFRIPTADSGTGSLLAFAIPSDSTSEDFGGVGLSVERGIARLIDGSDEPSVSRPLDGTRWHELLIERDPSHTRVRVSVDGTRWHEGLVSHGVQGPALVVRIASANCGTTNLLLDTVDLGGAP